MTTRSIMWFRRDLRLHDHPALAAACAEGHVLGLFVIDPVFANCGAARARILQSCLAQFRDATGGALVVRVGAHDDVVPVMAAAVDATTVFVTKDFGPYGRRRDRHVASALHAQGRQLRGVGSNYIHEPGVIVKDDGSAYSVFTPYLRRWERQPAAASVTMPNDITWLEAHSDSVPTARDPDWLDVDARWAEFRASGLNDYAVRRDMPALDGTSRLSTAIKFGVVHPRTLLGDLDESRADHRAFRSELAWRDFYADVLYRLPRTAWENLDQRFDRLHVDTHAAAHPRFDAWCRGETGFPIVDAGMRQLAATGWMHNRVRMITASFLVKDLHLPWQWGAQWFLSQLTDGDLASNNHGWQWSAGCGTDAAPFFRVFNPTTQQQRWDPDGEYVQRWIPELGSPTYPSPIVDHRVERAEALARYAAIKH